MSADLPSNHYRYWSSPIIRIYPRSRKNLLKKQLDDKNNETNIELPELKEILENYDQGETYSIAGKKFKNIEERIYLDLWSSEDEEKVIIKRKCCVGFLLELNKETYAFTDKMAYYYAIELEAESSIAGCSVYLECDGENSKNRPLHINLNDVPNRIKEFTIVVERNKSSNVNNGNIKIKAKYINSQKYTEYTLEGYRNTEDSLNGFKKNASGKDIDFYVLPRIKPSEAQKECTRQIQILHNQVFARNASLTDFKFIEETGEVVKTITDSNNTTTTVKIYEDMMDNLLYALDAFKYDAETDTGCKSDTQIGSLKTNFSYNFSDFGQQNNILEYLHDEYTIDSNTLKKSVYDRTFLFGDYTNGNPNSTIKGIVNLYTNVVIPFLNNLTDQIDLFHTFNNQWLSCPKYNEHYKRGSFTIQDGMNKAIYQNGQTINLSNIGFNGNQNNIFLPTGSIVSFKRGKDENAFNITGENFYQIESVSIQGTRYPSTGEFQNLCISLSLANKQACDDTGDFKNYGNYNDTQFNYGNFGIPYFVYGGSMPKWNQSKWDKMKKQELLSWNENANNWYSYTNKPNTESFGIDCSGLIVNSITGLNTENNHYFTTDTLDISAFNIGSNNCRQISTKENFDSNSFLSKNDIVFSTNHIAFCTDGEVRDSFNNSYVSMAKIADSSRNFNITHNYGEEFIYAETVNHNLFSMKTITGQFKHWGVKIKDQAVSNTVAHIGRIYLWKKN